MDEDIFKECLADRRVMQVYESLELQLNKLPPNGATNHKRDNVLNLLVVGLATYRKGIYPTNETFEQFCARNRRQYEAIVSVIHRALGEFRLVI
ncbi:MAG: hypothetical protein IID34_16935 [Planctomycetes bacterium]|nr:hypothetical protein [Planctomycetota bacterium]